MKSLRSSILRLFALTAVSLLAAPHALAQKQPVTVAAKTNFLYWATTTPNVGVEVGFRRHHSVQLYYGINPWKQGYTNKEGNSTDGTSLRHWQLMPEYRYWFCQTLNGWFVGAHLMGGEFNMGGFDLHFPGAFFGNSDPSKFSFKDNRYEGWNIGAGLTVGYQYPFAKHWSAEAAVGVGYDYIHYRKNGCGACGEEAFKGHTNYIGLTKASLALIYVF